MEPSKGALGIYWEEAIEALKAEILFMDLVRPNLAQPTQEESEWLADTLIKMHEMVASLLKRKKNG